MIAFITWNSNLVPLLDGLCSSNPFRFKFLISYPVDSTGTLRGTGCERLEQFRGDLLFRNSYRNSCSYSLPTMILFCSDEPQDGLNIPSEFSVATW